MILRSLDWLLLLPPASLAALWLWRGRMPSGRAVAIAGFTLVALAVALATYGTNRAITGAYTPAHLNGTAIVQGHGT